MRRSVRRVPVLLSFIALVGCGLGFESITGNNVVLIPWPNSSNGFSWQRVPLKSLDSPETLQNSRVRVFYRTGSNENGFSGKAVKPRMAKQGNVWVPLDVESALSLGAFAIMERLYEFDARFAISSGLRWPRQIGVEIPVRTRDGALINNALYDAELDVIAVAPYHIHQIPAALNHGIIAHEHFHAHFAAVWSSAGEPGAQKPDDKSAVVAVNRAVITGWNEGLADYYAFVFTRDPNFMRHTFSFHSSERRLNGDNLVLFDWRQIFSEMGCGETCTFNVKSIGYSYHNGTAMARWLYRWGEYYKDGHNMILQHIHRRLPAILGRVREVAASSPVSPAFLLEDLVNTSGLTVPSDLCEDLYFLTHQVTPAPSFGSCQ